MSLSYFVLSSLSHCDPRRNTRTGFAVRSAFAWLSCITICHSFFLTWSCAHYLRIRLFFSQQRLITVKQHKPVRLCSSVAVVQESSPVFTCEWLLCCCNEKQLMLQQVQHRRHDLRARLETVRCQQAFALFLRQPSPSQHAMSH